MLFPMSLTQIPKKTTRMMQNNSKTKIRKNDEKEKDIKITSKQRKEDSLNNKETIPPQKKYNYEKERTNYIYP